MKTKKNKTKSKPKSRQLPPNDEQRDEETPNQPGGVARARRRVSGMGSTFGDGSAASHDRDVGGKISGL